MESLCVKRDQLDRQTVTRLGYRPGLPVVAGSLSDFDAVVPQHVPHQDLDLHIGEMQAKAHMGATTPGRIGSLVR